MAHLNATLRGTPSLRAPTLVKRVQAFVATLKQTFRRRALYRQTLRELNALTEREMNDLGIHPAMISQMAREAAHGK